MPKQKNNNLITIHVNIDKSVHDLYNKMAGVKQISRFVNNAFNLAVNNPYLFDYIYFNGLRYGRDRDSLIQSL